MSTHESNLTKYFKKILPMSSIVQSEYIETAESRLITHSVRHVGFWHIVNYRIIG